MIEYDELRAQGKKAIPARTTLTKRFNRVLRDEKGDAKFSGRTRAH